VIATQQLEETHAASSALAGSGALQISRNGPRSYVRRAFAASPLRLLTPRNHGSAAWIYTSSFGGGLVDGDSVRLRIDVDEAAGAFVSTQASTKVYRSVTGVASTHLDAGVCRDGLLVVAPDPIVCFARSRYRQTQRFDLEGSAALILIDWFTSGRHATGERWMFDSYCSRSEIRRDGLIVWRDATLLDNEDGPVSARMGRFEVVATIVLSGPRLGSEVAAIRARISNTPVTRRAEMIVSGSLIADSTCIVRIAGVSVERVGRAIRRLLTCVSDLLGDDPWARRW
jgi:urease accessory protein